MSSSIVPANAEPGAMPDFDKLAAALPNFREVLDDLRKQLALCLETDDPIELPPLLLLGEPGIGKTHFARRLSQLLGTGYGFVSMSSLTAGWILSGASSQWRNAQMLYREIRDAHGWGAQFPETLDDAVADRLAGIAPREMRRQLVGAFGNAKLARRDRLAVEDLSPDRSARRSRIGF